MVRHTLKILQHLLHHFVWTCNYNAKNTISFSVTKTLIIYLMTPTDSTNDQNTILRIKEKTRNCLIFSVILETFAKF